MAGLGPAIHAFLPCDGALGEDVDGRIKSGHGQPKANHGEVSVCRAVTALGLRVEVQAVDLAHAAQRVMAERLEAAALADRGGEFRRDEHVAAEGFA